MKNRIGEINYNKLKNKMEIINYVSYKEVYVYFEKYDYTKKVTYQQFKNSEVACPYEPRTYGIGYLGDGEYKTKLNGKHTIYYEKWKKMLQRCYDTKFQEKYPSYIGCRVCDEWLNFQNFAEWFENNYYEVDGEKIHLDKDILIKGNKIYSPKTCLLVPQRINDLFVKRDNDRGNSPIGVCNPNKDNKYLVQCLQGDKSRFIGYYDNELEAFYAYKIAKESYIKEVADEYKDIIPPVVYDALYNYEIEITD